MMEGRNVFLFVVWSVARAHEAKIAAEIARRFRVLRDFEVAWPKRHFAANLAAFYGWRSWHIWRNKARKCGTGPFRVFVVEDPSPVWVRERDTSGHELTVDLNVYALKKSFRSLTGHSNVVHSSVTPEETAHQLAALDSPSVSPLPFRPMVYADEERVRRSRRRVWLGLAGDILVPLVAAVMSGAVVWVDVFVLGTKCVEGGLVEWADFLLAAVCGLLLAACSLRNKSGRGAYALFAAVFFVMVLIEADFMLDLPFGAMARPLALAVVTLVFAAVLVFVAIMVRYGKTVYHGLRTMRRSRRFPLFACGAALFFFVSQFLGRVVPWQPLGVADAAGFGHFVEESVELFGYALMSAWVLPLAFRLLRRSSMEGSR